MRKHTIVTVAATAATLAAVAASMPANAVSAKAPQVSDPIAEGLAGPLQLSVNKHGIAVAQSFAKTVSKVRPNGSLKNLVTEAGNNSADVAGVLLTRRGVVYTYTRPGKHVAKLKFVSNRGNTHTIADLAGYEADANPDQTTTYGFRNLSQSCADQLPEDFGPPSYTGIVESHPYAIAKAPGGWYVADAAGNDILKVSRSGNVRAVAVLPGQATVVTEEAAQNIGLPECTVGKRYWFEPVPTDVEALGGGGLVVSLLPGGPEDDSLGARGKVIRVNPATGAVRTMASGFAGATNVAVTDNARRIFVTNLMGGSISKLTVGGTSHYVDLPTPAALEWYKGKLYTGYDVFGPSGKIATIG